MRKERKLNSGTIKFLNKMFPDKSGKDKKDNESNRQKHSNPKNRGRN